MHKREALHPQRSERGPLTKTAIVMYRMIHYAAVVPHSTDFATPIYTIPSFLPLLRAGDLGRTSSLYIHQRAALLLSLDERYSRHPTDPPCLAMTFIRGK